MKILVGYKWNSINFDQVSIWGRICYIALICERSDNDMSRRAQTVKDPGLRSVADNDGDRPALLATTVAHGRAFSRWPRRR